MVENITFGVWLKRRRRQLDLTQKGLAYQADCSVGTIRKMEADERRPSRQLATLLAQELDIPPDQLDSFIAFARSEPYTAEVTFPTMSAPVDETPAIPEVTHQHASTSPAGRPPKHNLPAETTPFLGREREISELDKLLAKPDGRLVTIVGPGGIGKTRLALAYAKQIVATPPPAPQPGYPDRVYFVDLAPLREVEQIVLTLAETLGSRLQGGDQEQRSPKRQLLDYLIDRKLLLVMDNLEHLLTSSNVAGAGDEIGGADLVAEILKSAPDVSILVTSRERLNLRMEQVFPIAGLAFPDKETALSEREVGDVAKYPAMGFFLQVAQRNQPGFAMETHEELSTLVLICRLVGGMPLALELAASWVDTLSLLDIAAELQQGLDILETELRDVPQRQRSVRATFDYSWQKLDEREQSIFAQLSIFRGGFTRPAAQAVTGATLRQLSRLMNKSFIQFNKRRDRYQVHELLRQYGADRLARDNELERAVHDRHGTYYCQFLAGYTDDLKGARQAQASSAIETDIENVRLAWNHSVTQHDIEAIGISLESMWRFYWNSGRLRVDEFEKAVAALRTSGVIGARGIVLGRLLAPLGRFYGGSGYTAKAKGILEESLDLLQRLGAWEETLMPLLFLADVHESKEESNRLYQEGLTLAREIGDQWAMGHALIFMGWNARVTGAYEEAEQRIREGREQFVQTGDKGGVIAALAWLSGLAVDRGRYEEGLALARESLSLALDYGLSGLNNLGLFALGDSMYALDRSEEAEEWYQKFLSDARERDDREGISVALRVLGEVALAKGDHVRARQHFHESLAGTVELGSRRLVEIAQIHDALGRLNMSQGAGVRAREHFRNAMEAGITLNQEQLLLDFIVNVAELFAMDDDLETASVPAMLVTTHPASRAKTKERATRLLSRLEAELSPDELAAVRQRSQPSDLSTVAAQLLEDLETP